MSEGRFSGSGETDERVPVDMGDDTGSPSTITRFDARAQLTWGTFSTVAVASCWRTYAERRFQKRVVILREIHRDLGDVLQRVIADTPKPNGFVGRCNGGPSNHVV